MHAHAFRELESDDDFKKLARISFGTDDKREAIDVAALPKVSAPVKALSDLLTLAPEAKAAFDTRGPSDETPVGELALKPLKLEPARVLELAAALNALEIPAQSSRGQIVNQLLLSLSDEAQFATLVQAVPASSLSLDVTRRLAKSLSDGKRISDPVLLEKAATAFCELRDLQQAEGKKGLHADAATVRGIPRAVREALRACARSARLPRRRRAWHCFLLFGSGQAREEGHRDRQQGLRRVRLQVARCDRAGAWTARCTVGDTVLPYGSLPLAAAERVAVPALRRSAAPTSRPHHRRRRVRQWSAAVPA